MKRKRYAAIDIGSNAVRLLIKTCRPADGAPAVRSLKKELLLRVPLRLGFDVFETGELSDKKAERLRRFMKVCRQLLKIYEVDACRACATSALRDARNGKAVVKDIEKATGIGIEIISGQTEARMIYNNHAECLEDRTGHYMYVDVGGGSTEINFLTNGKLVASHSYDIGTVRMLGGNVAPGTWEQLERDLGALAQGIAEINIIGSGGNINKLYRLATRKESRRQHLPVESLRAVYEKLAPLSLDERMEKFGLKADRADVIVPAAEIFLRIAAAIRARYISVPVIGLADGIIDSLCAADAS